MPIKQVISVFSFILGFSCPTLCYACRPHSFVVACCCAPQTVARSSHFVDDIKRLRRAGGLQDDTSKAWRSRGTPANGDHVLACSRKPGDQETSLAEKLGVLAVFEKATVDNKGTASKKIDRGNGRGGCSRRRTERTRTPAIVIGSSPRPNGEGVSDNDDCDDKRYLSEQRFSPHRSPASSPIKLRHRSRSPTANLSPHSSTPKPTKTNQPKEDVNRLRRAVREALSPSSSRLCRLRERGGKRGRGLRGGVAGAWGGGGDFHAPQWSQQHEACLSGMRRSLRATGSPLLQARNPAVLIGALLRRQVGDTTKCD